MFIEPASLLELLRWSGSPQAFAGQRFADFGSNR
jgi:hypothetical protein